MRKINEIIIHCTDTPYGRDVSVDEIRQWHKEKGYDDIGYHYVIDLNGVVHSGRPVEKIGAHCKNHNAHSIGIAYVGGRHINGNVCCTLTYKQFLSLSNLITELLIKNPSINKVCGHNDYSNRNCPCFDVSLFAEFFGVLKGGVKNE